MNEPKRWSNSGSEADPVLRSVMRYARDLEPNSAQLSALVQATVARHRPTPAPRSRRRSKTWALVALAATFAAGAALASYAQHAWFAPPVAPAPAVSVVASSALPAPVAAPRLGVAVVPGPEPSAVAPASPSSAAPAFVTPSSVVSAPPVVDVANDAALLQQARSVIANNPARALTLTRDHELHFPTSALTEERQALRIEALARLGRQAEATRELAAFEQRFPRSIYARRLHALPVP